MSVKPWQNKWVCPACGRFYELKHFDGEEAPQCFLCDEQLQPWQERSNWAFFFLGLVVIPIIGRIFVLGAEAMGLN